MENNKEQNEQEPILDTLPQQESEPNDLPVEDAPEAAEVAADSTPEEPAMAEPEPEKPAVQDAPAPTEESPFAGMPSMEELLSDEDLILEFPKPGEIKTGFIVRKNEDEILVSIGAKSEGVIPSRELSQLAEEDLAELTVGSEVTVVVVTLEDSHGNLVLSYTRAQEEADWDRAEALLASEELYESEIAGYNKGGLIVKLGRLRGFVPASQVSLSRRMAYGGSTPDQRWGKMVGQPIIVKVLEVDRERQRLIFSELAVLQESREIFKERLLNEISVGDELDGRVTSLADFGAFVNINGADGLVHLTELAWERVKHPSEVLKVGQTVRVRVISIDEERKRIGLSIKALLEDPWPEKVAHLREGQLIQAKIVRLVKFGAFARLEGLDIEGLVHISELSEQRVEHPKEVLAEGEELTLRIVRIEPEQHRIGLSLRKVHSAAYSELDLQMALEAEAAAAQAEAEEEQAAEAAAQEGEESPEMESEAGAEAPAEEAEGPAETETQEGAQEMEMSAEAEADEPPAAVAAEAPEMDAQAKVTSADPDAEAPAQAEATSADPDAAAPAQAEATSADPDAEAPAQAEATSADPDAAAPAQAEAASADPESEASAPDAGDPAEAETEEDAPPEEEAEEESGDQEPVAEEE